MVDADGLPGSIQSLSFMKAIDLETINFLEGRAVISW
jgi:hypothetical protein